MSDSEGYASVTIRSEADIVTARQHGRRIANDLGFSSGEQALITTAISELARNIVLYAREGQIELREVNRGARRGLLVVASDHGPGIANIELALRDGFSTSGGLGMGLPGSRRLMDEFSIESALGRGTTVRGTRWKR